MSKELDALNDMLEYLLTYDEFNEKRHKHNASVIETALKDYEKKTKLAKEYADVNNVAKRLKALEIIKSAGFSLEFDESQNEWFLHISARGSGIKTFVLLKEVLS